MCLADCLSIGPVLHTLTITTWSGPTRLSSIMLILFHLTSWTPAPSPPIPRPSHFPSLACPKNYFHHTAPLLRNLPGYLVVPTAWRGSSSFLFFNLKAGRKTCCILCNTLCPACSGQFAKALFKVSTCLPGTVLTALCAFISFNPQNKRSR